MYLGSMISDTLSLDVKLDKCIGKATTMFFRLTKRVWLNKKLMAYTKIQVSRACFLYHLCMAGEGAEDIPYAFSLTHFWYHLTGQSSK